MWTEEIVVRDKERDMGIGTFSASVAVGDLIGELEGPVEALNDLLQPAIFFGDGVVIGKADDLDQVEIHALEHELLLG